MKTRKRGTKKNKRTRKKRGSGGCLSCLKKKKSPRDEVAKPAEIKPLLPRQDSTIRIPRTTSMKNIAAKNPIPTIRRRTPSPSNFDDPKTMAHDNVDFAAIGFEDKLKKLPSYMGGGHYYYCPTTEQSSWNEDIPCDVDLREVDYEGQLKGEHHGGRKKKTRKYKGKKYPYKNITKTEAITDFIKLKTTTNPRSLNGLEIVNYGTEKLRVRTKYRGKSLIERWKDKKARKTLKKFANRLYKGSYTDSLLHAYRSAIALSWGTLSSMRTSAALQMYRKYNAKKVLDFTAGWGSRMTAALAADIDYIGIDTNKSLKKGYNKIIKTVKKHTKSKVKLFFQPAETVDYSKLDYDFVFTSPPYEYLELYEHMKNYEGTKKIKQAYSANDTKRKNDGFYDTFLIPTIKEIYKHLPKGKWICLKVPDLMYDKIKKKWKACDKKEDYMISKRVGSVMKAADRRGQEFVYCWKKK